MPFEWNDKNELKNDRKNTLLSCPFQAPIPVGNMKQAATMLLSKHLGSERGEQKREAGWNDLMNWEKRDLSFEALVGPFPNCPWLSMTLWDAAANIMLSSALLPRHFRNWWVPMSIPQLSILILPTESWSGVCGFSDLIILDYSRPESPNWEWFFLIP